MGWTGYPGMNAQQAVAEEFGSTEILKRSGNWILYRTSRGYVGLCHVLTERGRQGGAIETFVKVVDIEMGPGMVPPASIAKAYLAHYNGDFDEAGGSYGAQLLRQSVAPKEKPAAFTRGTRFRLNDDRDWSDGRPMAGEYTFLGGYRAMRYDGRTVCLAKNWRRRYSIENL